MKNRFPQINEFAIPTVGLGRFKYPSFKVIKIEGNCVFGDTVQHFYWQWLIVGHSKLTKILYNRTENV